MALGLLSWHVCATSLRLFYMIFFYWNQHVENFQVCLSEALVVVIVVQSLSHVQLLRPHEL